MRGPPVQRIGVLTFQWALSFGAQWQARSLVQFIRSNVGACELIPFVPRSRQDELGWIPRRFWRGGFPRWVQRGRFRAYRGESIGGTALDGYGPGDSIVVGSDQVWNPRITGASGSAYFLADFVRRGGRAVSYAASCGEPQKIDEWRALGAAAIRDFHALSVRDSLTAETVAVLGGDVHRIVVDPTLLDYTGQGDADFKKGGHMLAYFVNPVDRWVYDSLKAEAGRRGVALRIVGGHGTTGLARARLASLGPGEWLEMIRCARAVYTDSYHGSIAAIKYNIPFVTQVSPDRGSRISYLFKRLGIAARMVEPGAFTAHCTLFDSAPVDSAAKRTLIDWRNDSTEFLIKALS